MQRRKINLAKVQASLDAICPKCGKIITPAEVRRIDSNEWSVRHAESDLYPVMRGRDRIRPSFLPPKV